MTRNIKARLGRRFDHFGLDTYNEVASLDWLLIDPEIRAG
jgi:hypothetical protein